MKLGCMLIILRSSFPLLEVVPLTLGTYINLQFLLGGVLSMFLVEEKAEPKLLIISSNLSILAGPCSILSLTIGSFYFNIFNVAPTLEPN